jgi:MoaA/NifB/PqqE/SkfB family radical SAM enzyme
MLIPWSRAISEVLRANLAALYPGILRQVGVRPLYANFWVTTRCSGRCQTCTQWRQPAVDEMNTPETREAILCLKKAGAAIIYFVGGDVFLREDIFELIRFAEQIGLRTHLTLNAFTVTAEVARALRATRVASIHLSLDALSADFDRIRGTKDASGKVLKALRLLQEGGPSSIRLGLTSTIMKRTISTVPDVVRFALANRLTVFFNLINFTHHFFATEFSRQEYELSAEDKTALAALVSWLKQKRIEYPHLMPRLDHLDWIRAYFDDRHQRQTPCFQTLLKICVLPNGDVRPCCSMETAGNLRTQAMEDILTSEPYIALIQKALAKDCPGCSCRYTINLDVSPGSWVRELRQRTKMALR